MTWEYVLRRIAQDPNKTVLLAGGTDLMVNPEGSGLNGKEILDLSQIEFLRGIKIAKNQIEIGALTTYSQIRKDEIMRKYFPMLVQAAKVTGALAIQNRGTIGGNVANASPAADSPLALLAYDADVVLGSVRGERNVAYSQFHTGYKQTQKAPDEVIIRFCLPIRDTGFNDYYEKVGTRAAQSISKVGIAATSKSHENVLSNVRIAFSSVAPVPLRCMKTESVLEGKRCNDARIREALDALKHEITPIDDIRSRARYRMHVAYSLLENYLTRLC